MCLPYRLGRPAPLERPGARRDRRKSPVPRRGPRLQSAAVKLRALCSLVRDWRVLQHPSRARPPSPCEVYPAGGRRFHRGVQAPCQGKAPQARHKHPQDRAGCSFCSPLAGLVVMMPLSATWRQRGPFRMQKSLWIHNLATVASHFEYSTGNPFLSCEVGFCEQASTGRRFQ
jgi:hypothetical protein